MCRSVNSQYFGSQPTAIFAISPAASLAWSMPRSTAAYLAFIAMDAVALAHIILLWPDLQGIGAGHKPALSALRMHLLTVGSMP